MGGEVSRTMAAAATAALLVVPLAVMGVSSWGRYQPPFDYQDFPRFALSGVHKAKEDAYDDRPKYDPKAVYYIPVKFDFNRGITERSVKPYDADSPKLIMDKDFNIRFDNPYIVPLTKPLALVLDSRIVKQKESASPPHSNEKMMIPFPVLVKARKPLLDAEGYREYRDEDDVPEHRSADFEDAPEESTVKPPLRREVPKTEKRWKNGTRSSASRGKKNSLYSLEDEQPRPETTRYKPPRYEQEFNSTYHDTSLDIYPGKIFAEMYRNIPTFSADSEESREVESRPAQASSEVTGPSPPWRPRTSRYPGSEQLFAAATDLQWVTHANSTKLATPAFDRKETRIVVRDVEEDDETIPETTSTTVRPEQVTISRKFWRTV